MINEKKISIEKVISDIKESNGNGKRKGCHGLHQCLSDDGYIRQIVCWTRITSPDRIDALVEHADKQNAEITALRTALTALTSQLESVVAENAVSNDRLQKLIQIINNTDNSYCMCGDAMRNHAHGGCGHPTGMFDYHYSQWLESAKETPATSAFLAEVRASGVDAAIEHLLNKFEGTGHIGAPVMALEWLAKDLRQGGAA